MADYALAFSLRLSAVTCCKCGIVFGIPAPLEASLRESHDIFYCPTGHPQHFTSETAIEDLKKRNLALQKKVEWAQREARLATEEAKKVTKKLQTANEERKKLKKRIKEGVCPCCHRTFSNLRDHMVLVHPEFGDEPV